MPMYKETGRRFILDEDRDERGYSEEVRKFSMDLYLEGLGVRSISRTVGCCAASVINWVRDAAAKLPPLESTFLEETRTGIAELDELWHYYKKKEERNGSGLQSTE